MNNASIIFISLFIIQFSGCSGDSDKNKTHLPGDSVLNKSSCDTVYYAEYSLTDDFRKIFIADTFYRRSSKDYILVPEKIDLTRWTSRKYPDLDKYYARIFGKCSGNEHISYRSNIKEWDRQKIISKEGIEWVFNVNSEIGNYFDSLILNLQRAGTGEGYLIIKNKDEGSKNPAVIYLLDNNSSSQIYSDGSLRFRNVGFINAGNSKDIFLQAFEGGNGSCPMLTNILILYNPGLKKFIRMDITYCPCPGEKVIYDKGENFNNPEMRTEKKILENLKYAYSHDYN